MRMPGLLAFLAGWLCLAGAAWAAERPVVVELYTSQGCASCLTANQAANQLSQRKGLLVLAFPVDYWDYLGWKDTYARPAFAARQRFYARALGRRGVATPQVVVDGAFVAPGRIRERVEGLIAKARASQSESPEMMVREDGRVAIGSGRTAKAGVDVWLIRFDPRPRRVVVRKGENAGKTVVQRNVVRQVAKLGAWTGKPGVYSLPAGRAPTLKSCVLLQARSGRIIGVLPLDPPPAPEPSITP